jgi:hypothetical protein
VKGGESARHALATAEPFQDDATEFERTPGFVLSYRSVELDKMLSSNKIVLRRNAVNALHSGPFYLAISAI